MQRISLYFVLIFMVFGCLLITPMPAKAYSPVIAECNANVNHTNGWIDIFANQVKQLIDVRLDHYYLDGIAARLYAAGGQEAQVTVQVKNRDGTTIAAVRGGTIIGADPAWYYIDLPNTPIPRATYWVEIASYSGNPYWNYTSDSTCIEDSYAVINGDDRGFQNDMGFAVYAYDNSQSNPDQSVPSGSSDQLQGSNDDSSNTSNSGTSKSAGSSNSSSQYPSKEDILKMSKDDSGGLGLWSGLFATLGGPIIGAIISLIGFLLFVGVIVLVIVLIARRKKTPQKEPPKESIHD